MTQRKMPIMAINGTTNTQSPGKEKKPTATEKQPTVEDLQKQLEAVKSQLSKIPSSLEERQEYFKMKNQLLNKFTKLGITEKELTEHLDQLAEKCAQDDFINDEYALVIQTQQRYNNPKDIFTIKNPTLIGEVLEFILAKIRIKKEELKAEIEA